MEGQGSHEHQRSIQPARSSTEKSRTPRSSTPRLPRRRAPITNVACQECRKRKTKCNGTRPNCSNCAKIGNATCYYDAEGTQSNKIAIYKLKLEKQAEQMQEMQTVISRLQEETSQRSGSNTPLPLPLLVQSSSSSRLPLLPAIKSSSSPEKIRLNPLNLLHDEPQILNPLSSIETMDRRFLEDELTFHLRQQRALQTENHRLKELVVLLTLLDDRGLAEGMAIRIQQEGVTDDLLCEANALIAAGRAKHTQPQVTNVPTLPKLSSLDLPTISSAPSAPYTPDADPELQASRYPLPPPQSLNSAGSGQGAREAWT